MIKINQKYFAIFVSLLVVTAVVFGFFIVGSPAKERMRRQDEQRTNDLNTIQSQIINYWQQKGRLPSSLNELEDGLGYFTMPLDPATGGEYEYKIISSTDLSFELCANFNLKIDNQGDVIRERIPSLAGVYGPGAWTHEAGRFCFERVIDPELYKRP